MLFTQLSRLCGPGFYLFAALLIVQLGWLTSAHAQFQRSIVNPSFELPFTGPRASGLNAAFNSTNWVAVDQGELVGWSTTHPLVTNGCPAGGGLVLPYTCTPIELWFNNFIVPSVQGRVVAELNAYSGSKLFQDVCLVDGESFDFNFAHRGRGGADTAQFQVGASSSVILDVTTGTSGTGTINASAASSSNATGIAGGWTRYSGSYTYSGLSGIQSLGFAAVSTFGGSLGAGNVLDDINITLKPFIEFRSASSTGAERNPITGPSIKVTGLVPSTGLTITLTVGGNANFGSDFDFTGATTLTGVIGNSSSLTVTIPAGNYDDAQGNNTFVLPLRIIDDQMIESNETVTFDLPANSPTAAFEFLARQLAAVQPIQGLHTRS